LRYLSKPIEFVARSRQFWTKFTSGSVNRRIFGAALTVGMMTALVGVFSLLKDILVAARFGRGDEIDAFLLAWVIPGFLVNLVAGSFNVSLIPTYIQVLETQGRESAQKLLSKVMVLSLGLLIIVTILMILVAPWYLSLIARGFSVQKSQLTLHLLWMLAPWLVLSGIIVIAGAVLNAQERFTLMALSPSITPIIIIFFLLIRSSWGIYGLPLAFLLGATLELVVLGIALRHQKISLLPKWDKNSKLDESVRQVIRQYLPMIAGSFIQGSNNLIDQSMAAILAPGSIAALHYGNKLITIPMTLSSIALSRAVMPYLSKMTASQDWENLKYTIEKYLKLIFFSAVPLTIFIILISEPLIRIVFQRGVLTNEDTKIISQIQSCYSLQIPFTIAGIVIVRVISSLKANHILMKAAVWNCLLNILLNFILIKLMGISGIALSTSFVMLYSYIYVGFHSSKLIKQKQVN
jgi:putative peptidoglycan lipid II flippase